jgi:NitT/TauT family transport system permease protein
MRTVADILPVLGLLLLIIIGWQVVKFIGGSPWRIDTVVLGQPIQTVWEPPLDFRFANDINMPHMWDIFAAFARPASRNGPPLIEPLIAAAFFTFRIALIGFALGSSFGLLFAIVVIHSPLLNRIITPIVVASQTIPILVIAPMIVIWLRAGWFSIALIAAYLSFFPVTIAALRGLRSVKPNDLELMQSYAASPLQVLLKLRLPSAVPYLFVGFKIAITASVIGTIVGELPSGISDGLGAIILNFTQYYTTGPAKLWASLIVTALVGISAFSLVQIAEIVLLARRGHAAGID